MKIFCLGELNLSHKDYYCSTPRELSELIQGWQRRHARYMEGVRLICHTLAQVNSSKRISKPEIWMPLITDENFKDAKRVTGKPSAEEIARAKTRIELAKQRQFWLKDKTGD